MTIDGSVIATVGAASTTGVVVLVDIADAAVVTMVQMMQIGSGTVKVHQVTHVVILLVGFRHFDAVQALLTRETFEKVTNLL